MIDGKDGTLLGKIDLGGVPEQAVPVTDRGALCGSAWDAVGGVPVVDTKANIGDSLHYSFVVRRLQRSQHRSM